MLLLVLVVATLGVVEGQSWVDQYREKGRGVYTIEEVDWDRLTSKPHIARVVCQGDTTEVDTGYSPGDRHNGGNPDISDRDIISVRAEGTKYIISFDKPGTARFKYSFFSHHRGVRGGTVKNYHDYKFEYQVWRCVNYFPKPVKLENGKLQIKCGMSIPGASATNRWKLNGTELPLLENKMETVINTNDTTAHGMYSCEQWFEGQGGRQHATGMVFVGVAPAPTIKSVKCLDITDEGHCRRFKITITPPNVRAMSSIHVAYGPMSGEPEESGETTKDLADGPLEEEIVAELIHTGEGGFTFPGVVTAQLKSNLGIDGLIGSLIVDSASA